MKKQSFTKTNWVLLALAAIMMAMPAMAQGSPKKAPSSGTCGPVDCTGTISSIAVVNSPAPEPNIFVSMNITGAPSNCRLVDDYYFILASGTDGYPQMYKLLLRAYSQGETVTIRTTFSPVVGFNDPCTVDYVVLDQ